MANPLGKGWNYLTSSLDKKIEDNADPHVQIEQAIAAEKERHQHISDSAAEIIGTKSQLEMKLNRLLESQEEYQSQAREAIKAADSASNPEDAERYNQTAEVLASQLVSVEQEIEATTKQHEEATRAAEQAKRQQQESEARLREQLSQVEGLRQQADQAKLQETSAEILQSEDPLAPDDSVPTLDAVRSKIERRYTDALGAQEIYQSSVGDQIQQIQAEGNDMRATARLDQLRQEMKGIEAGSNAGDADSPAADEQK